MAQCSLRASERVRLCAIAAAFSRSCSRRDAKALPLRTLTPAEQVPAARRASVDSFESPPRIRGVFLFALEFALSRAY